MEEEKKRSLLSLRLKDCYQGETSVGVDILEENLDEIETVRTAFRAGKGRVPLENGAGCTKLTKLRPLMQNFGTNLFYLK